MDAVGVAQGGEHPASITELLEHLHRPEVHTEEQLREVVGEFLVGRIQFELTADVVEVLRFGELIAFEGEVGLVGERGMNVRLGEWAASCPVATDPIGIDGDHDATEVADHRARVHGASFSWW